MFQNGIKSANTQGRSLENNSSEQKVLSQVLEMLSSASTFLRAIAIHAYIMTLNTAKN